MRPAMRPAARSRLIAGPEQENDMARANALIDGLAACATIGDKSDDADPLEAKIIGQGGQIVIPPRRHRKTPRAYDKVLYKQRNRIERFFNKLKQFRRVATRYDKLLVNVIGFVKRAAIAIWLRSLNRRYSLAAQHGTGAQPNTSAWDERTRPAADCLRHYMDHGYGLERCCFRRLISSADQPLTFVSSIHASI